MSDPSTSHEPHWKPCKDSGLYWALYTMWTVGVWPLPCVGLSQTIGEKISERLSVDHLRNHSDKTEFYE